MPEQSHAQFFSGRGTKRESNDWACKQPRKQYVSVLTVKPVGDKEVGVRQEETPKKNCTRANDFPTKPGEPYKDKQKNWKQAWPHYARSTGQKHVPSQISQSKRPKKTEREDVRAKRMQERMKDREVLTSPRNKVKEIEAEM